MRFIPAVGLAVLLLATACGQPVDLVSSAPASETPAAASTSDSAAIHTIAETTTPLPCPTTPPMPSYPSPSQPDATPMPTSTPVPSPTIDPEAVPVETAPGGLGTMTIPNDDATLRGIFAALPKQIGKYQGSTVEVNTLHAFGIEYISREQDPNDPRSGLSLEAQRGYDDTRAFPERFSAPSDEWRRDGRIFYRFNETYRHCYPDSPTGLLFTAADSPWSFYVKAETREEIELLLSAFVQAVNASPAPIPYVAPTPWPIPTPRPGYPAPGSYPPPQEGLPQQMPTATPTSTPFP